MSNIDIDLLIKDRLWKGQKDINKVLMSDVFNMVLDYLKIPLCKNPIEISITLTDDKNIRVLNKNYRHKDKPTNVLTFSLYEKKSDIISDIKKLPCMSLGDIIFSFDTINQEAEEQGKTFKDHFIHMLVHSYLHLFGYDHIKPDEQNKMETMEIKILAKMGIANPYI